MKKLSLKVKGMELQFSICECTVIQNPDSTHAEHLGDIISESIRAGFDIPMQVSNVFTDCDSFLVHVNANDLIELGVNTLNEGILLPYALPEDYKEEDIVDALECTTVDDDFMKEMVLKDGTICVWAYTEDYFVEL